MKCTYKQIRLIIILIIVILTIIIYYIPMSLIKTLDVSGNFIVIISNNYMLDAKAYTETKQYKLIHNSDSYNKIIDYFNKYKYRRSYGTYLKKYDYDGKSGYNLIIFFRGNAGKNFALGGDNNLMIGKYNFTHKIIFDKNDNMNKFVENIIEIIKEDEVPLNS